MFYLFSNGFRWWCYKGGNLLANYRFTLNIQSKDNKSEKHSIIRKWSKFCVFLFSFLNLSLKWKNTNEPILRLSSSGEEYTWCQIFFTKYETDDENDIDLRNQLFMLYILLLEILFLLLEFRENKFECQKSFTWLD